jgi:broad specificity phosphatase PhoE
VQLFVLARHAESVLNHENRINGDPSVEAPLTDRGRDEARLLGLQVRSLPLDACLHTRFGRTAETARIAMEGRDVPLVAETLFDDVRVGELEGWTIDAYRAWKRQHRRSDRFPGGESLDDAAARYAESFRRLLESAYNCALVVCHEIPIRYALNGAAGSDSLDRPVHAIPNATPFLFDEHSLGRVVEGIDRLAATVSL